MPAFPDFQQAESEEREPEEEETKKDGEVKKKEPQKKEPEKKKPRKHMPQMSRNPKKIDTLPNSHIAIIPAKPNSSITSEK